MSCTHAAKVYSQTQTNSNSVEMPKTDRDLLETFVEKKLQPQSMVAWSARRREAPWRRVLFTNLTQCPGCGGAVHAFRYGGASIVRCARMNKKKVIDWATLLNKGVEKLEDRLVPDPCGYNMKF